MHRCLRKRPILYFPALIIITTITVFCSCLNQSNSFRLTTPGDCCAINRKIVMMSSSSSSSSSTFQTTSLSSSDLSDFFPFIHPSIATVLACIQQHQSPSSSVKLTTKAVLDDDDYTIRLVHVQDDCGIKASKKAANNACTSCFDQTDLVELALLCDDAVFLQNSTFTASCPSRQALVQLGKGSCSSMTNSSNSTVTCTSDGTKTTLCSTSVEITAATLLALNALESSIRRRHYYLQHSTTSGGAPLLKTMIQTFEGGSNAHHLIPILQALLLPTGLNLRNLLWHGFCGTIPRPWLALVLILIENINRNGITNNIVTAQSSLAQGNGNTSSNKGRPATLRSRTEQDEDCNVSTRSFWAWQTQLSQVIQRGEILLQEIIKSDMTPYPGTASLRQTIQNWLPSSHYELWNLALKWMMFCNHDDENSHEQHESFCFGACSAALMVILLEHGLRLDWCRLNDRRQDKIARPSVYYITLDGHGQRLQHDLLLHPYRTAASTSASLDADAGCFHQDDVDEEMKKKKKNYALVDHLGGSATALLSDIFCSPNGPNLRAALAHGLWDDFLEHELILMYNNNNNNDNDDKVGWYNADAIRNCNLILLVAMEQAAMATISSASASNSLSTFTYYPRFSWTATAISNITTARCILQQLHDILQDETTLALMSSVSSIGPTNTTMAQLQLPRTVLESHFQLVLDSLSLSYRDSEQVDGKDDLSWKSSDSVYIEHETNKQLAPLGASRTLLNDIEQALNCYFAELQQAREKLIANVQQQQSEEEQPQQGSKPLKMTSRQQKRLQRIIACGYVFDIFCSFSLFVAMLSLEDGLDILPTEMQVLQSSDMLRAVERTRMTVSTVNTFFTTNAERAFKSIEDYVKGKEVKKIINSVVATSKFVI